MQLMLELQHQISAAMRLKMQRIDSFSFTVDSWTSLGNRQFLAITAHGITNGWVLESFVLGLVPVRASETGEYVARELKDMLATWCIEESKAIAVTTDGASNMQNFVLKQVRFPWIYCAAHALNLVIRKGLALFLSLSLSLSLLSLLFSFFFFSSSFFLFFSLLLFKYQTQHLVNLEM